LNTVPKAENKTWENRGKQNEQAIESRRKAYENQLFCKFIFSLCLTFFGRQNCAAHLWPQAAKLQEDISRTAEHTQSCITQKRYKN